MHSLRHVMLQSFCVAQFFPKLRTQACRGLGQIRSIMEIKIYPEDPLVDEKLEIKISGLNPNSKITIKTSLSEAKTQFSAIGCFVSDSTGNVYVHKQPSLGGTYTGTDSMGLFWSMIPDPGQQKGLRYVKRNVTTPQTVSLSVYEGHMQWEDCHDTELPTLVSKDLYRWFMHTNVKREEIREGNLRGTLFTPSGPGPFPGVIDMFGTAGGITEYRAAMLASRGFISYALPYFNYEDLPKDFTSISYEYLMESVDWFCRYPKVIQDGIGVLGVSKGGELALMLAYQNEKIKAVVNINGPPFVCHSPIGPFTNIVEADASKLIMEDEGVNILDFYPYDNVTTDHIIKMWETNTQVMCIVGEDDQSVNPKFADMLYNLYPEDQRHKLTIKRYPNAGHLIEPCYNPFCRASYHKVFGMIFIWGGEMQAHAKAQEDSWQCIQEFFKSTLVPPSFQESTTHISSQL